MVTKALQTTGKGIRRYTDEVLFEVYELAANGLSKHDIAATFQLDYRRYKRWQENHPLLKIAYAQGKAVREARKEKGKTTETIEHYVYKRLSPTLKKYWDKLKELDSEKNASRNIEAFFKEKSPLIRQQLFLHALISKSFKMSDALRITNTSWSTVQEWMNNPQFKGMVSEIQQYKRMFVDDAVMVAVAEGQPWAIQMAAKGLLRDQYGDKQLIEHTGHIEHSHEQIDLSSLSLPLRKAIAKELEANKEEVQDAEIVVP